jgi:RNA polymerase subunit RPABC4/transcription elongation factor Spt4
MEDRCVCCGEIIPEGRMVCPQCESKYLQEEHTND